MPVTLADIARELGVSKMTVSRAINNNPLISSATRKRVLELARRMNYQPNQHARALATNRSYLIGIIIPDIMNLYFAEVIRAIETVARPAGFQLLICGTDEDTTRTCLPAFAALIVYSACIELGSKIYTISMSGLFRMSSKF